MVENAVCWKCDAPLTDIEQPFPRASECPSCTADLHVCHMCKFFDPDAARGCREPVAEEVRDRTRANFCGWFMVGSPRPAGASGSSSRDQLQSLFGMEAGEGSGSPTNEDAARSALDALFAEKPSGSG
jgi:hypothetical protein